MSGFPNRISRDTLGANLRDIYPPENPETDIGAAAFNTLFWQVSGMNAVMPVRAAAIVEYSGAVLSTLYQAEAWNPNNDVAHPVIARTGTGVYTVTFAASYVDETGATVATSLLFARARFLGDMSAWANKRDAFAWIDSSNPLQVNVTTWNSSTGAAADAKFLVEVA